MFVMSIAATQKWEIETMDVEKAFLQSRHLERDVFINPPKEATGNDRSKVWKLKTAVYGIGDAAREWYLTVKKLLKDLASRKQTGTIGILQNFVERTLRRNTVLTCGRHLRSW